MKWGEQQALLKDLGVKEGSIDEWPDGSRTVIRYHGDLAFETLDRIAICFGTRRIDLGVDTGCASDPSVDPYIIVWAPVPPQPWLIVTNVSGKDWQG